MATKAEKELKKLARQFEAFGATRKRQAQKQAEREERLRKQIEEAKQRQEEQQAKSDALWMQAVKLSGFTEKYPDGFKLLTGLILVSLDWLDSHGEEGVEICERRFNEMLGEVEGNDEEEAEEKPKEKPVTTGTVAGNSSAKKSVSASDDDEEYGGA